MSFEIFLKQLKDEWIKENDLLKIKIYIERYIDKFGNLTISEEKLIVSVLSGEYDPYTKTYLFSDSDNSAYLELLKTIVKARK